MDENILIDDEYSRFDGPLLDEYSEDAEIASDLVDISASEFTEFAFYLPSGGVYKRFSFEGRDYLKQIYDTGARRRLLIAGRQVEKSTLLGNQMLTYVCTIPGFRALYVSPSNTQTKTFSRDRIQEPIETSKFLKGMTNSKLTSNILEKSFINRSKVTLRFAFLNADRVRGIPADYILIDEFQDILLDNVPVIEECASHSEHKLFTYAGTPKTLDNAIEHYWSRFSTQNEWVVPCKRHGTPNDSSTWHWNVLDESNIGLKGLICDKCGENIKPDDPDAQWASLNPNPKVSVPYEGYRIPQLMVPWIDWGELLDKFEKYARGKFYNEVLGRSYDSGVRPLTMHDIVENCNPELSMYAFEEVAKNYSNVPVFMGVDWGSGEGDSYTVITLGGYFPWSPNKYSIFYAKRCQGRDSEPAVQLEIIEELNRMFQIQGIGADYGGGFYQNDELIRRFGANKVHRYQWIGNPKKKITFDSQLGTPRYLCHRTEVMSDIFNAIKRCEVFQFPKWEEWNEPFAMDMLNIFSEYNEKTRQNVYKRGPGMPDDTFHSLCYSFLASMHYRKRPDVILPKKRVDLTDSEQVDSREDYDTY